MSVLNESVDRILDLELSLALKTQEISSLQQALSKAQQLLYDQKQQILTLVHENDKLRSNLPEQLTYQLNF